MTTKSQKIGRVIVVVLAALHALQIFYNSSQKGIRPEAAFGEMIGAFLAGLLLYWLLWKLGALIWRFTRKHWKVVVPTLVVVVGLFFLVSAITENTEAVRAASMPGEKIQLVRGQNEYQIDALLNGVQARFVLDTGASSLIMPLSWAKDLAKYGALTKADYRGKGTFKLADGSTAELYTYNLKSVTIGNITVHDVELAVGDDNAQPLLGMSVLNKLKSWSIDNKRALLIVGG